VQSFQSLGISLVETRDEITVFDWWLQSWIVHVTAGKQETASVVESIFSQITLSLMKRHHDARLVIIIPQQQQHTFYPITTIKKPHNCSKSKSQRRGQVGSILASICIPNQILTLLQKVVQVQSF
jgi:hypothetical protein